MARKITTLAVVFVLAAGVQLYHKWTTPDIYAKCDQKRTELERQQCINQISFAMAAGL